MITTPAPPASTPPVPLRRPPPARPGEPRPAPATRRVQENGDPAEASPRLIGSSGSGWPGSGPGGGSPPHRDPRHRPALAAAPLPRALDPALRPLRRWAARRSTPKSPPWSPEWPPPNPLWGAPRIHGELLKLGIDVAERTVSRLLPKRRTPPSQTWRTFLTNHVRDLVSIDFFTVPTARLRVLFVLVVLAHHRRRVVHFNVTEHPTAAWTAQQIVEAFPDDTAPSYLLRDRDTHLRSRVPAPREGHGNPGSTDRAPEPVAEPLREAAHRLDPARVVEACGRSEAGDERTHRRVAADPTGVRLRAPVVDGAGDAPSRVDDDAVRPQAAGDHPGLGA